MTSRRIPHGLFFLVWLAFASAGLSAGTGRAGRGVESIEREREEFSRSYSRYGVNPQPRLVHQYLLQLPPSEARQFVGQMSLISFGAFLNGLDEGTRAEIARLSDQVGANATAMNWKAWQEWPPSDESRLLHDRARYLAYLEARDAERVEQAIAAVSPDGRSRFAEYGQAAGVSDPRQPSLSVKKKWLEAEEAAQQRIFREFPYIDETSSERGRYGRFEDSLRESRHGEDPHELDYKRRALSDFVAKDPECTRWGFSRWKLNTPSVEQTWDFIQWLKQPLPGRSPEVVFFLDSLVARGPIADMTAAWAESGRGSPRQLDHVDLDRFLSEFHGRTLVLIGHIEDRFFVQYRPDHLPPLRIEIPGLVERALAAQVNLVPIGCRSAEAGVSFGFTRPIDTSEVSTLLRSIPSGELTLGDLFSAFSKIGSVAVNVTDFNHAIDLIVEREPTVGSRNSDRPINDARSTPSELTPEDALDRNSDRPIIVARFPGPFENSTSTGGVSPSSFAPFFAGWESEHRPWTDRGVLKMCRHFFREYPFLALAGIGAILYALAAGWKAWRIRFARRKQLIGPLEYHTTRIVSGLSIAFVGASAVGLLWTVGSFVVENAPGLSIIGGLVLVRFFFDWLKSKKA